MATPWDCTWRKMHGNGSGIPLFNSSLLRITLCNFFFYLVSLTLLTDLFSTFGDWSPSMYRAMATNANAAIYLICVFIGKSAERFFVCILTVEEGHNYDRYAWISFVIAFLLYTTVATTGRFGLALCGLMILFRRRALRCFVSHLCTAPGSFFLVSRPVLYVPLLLLSLSLFLSLWLGGKVDDLRSL